MCFAKLDELCHRLQALEHALAILGADEATHMAVGGGAERAEAMAALAGMHNAQATAPEGRMKCAWMTSGGSRRINSAPRR